MSESVYEQIERLSAVARSVYGSEFARIAEMARALLDSPAMKAQQRQFAQVARSLKPLASEAERCQKLISELAKQLRHVVAALKAVDGEPAYMRFWEIMVELGWPPPMAIAIEDANRFVAQYDEGGPEAIRKPVEAHLLAIYDKTELAGLVRKWASKRFLAQRLAILRAAVEAHADGNYCLSVPALILQVEGIIVQCFEHKGWLNSTHLKGYADALMSGDETDRFIRGACDAAAKHFLFEWFWAQFTHGGEAPLFSRHAILHGADTAYGTAANSLRAILFLDYIIGKFQLVSTKNGRCYHIVGCSAVGGRPNPVFYDNRAAAKAAGKAPCQRCRPDEAIYLG